MADITEEEIQRRRSEGEVITLRVATDPGDLNNYVDDRGVIIGQPVGEQRRIYQHYANLTGLPMLSERSTQEIIPPVIETTIEDNAENIAKADSAFRQLSPEATPPPPNKPPGSGPTASTITAALLSQGKRDLKENSPKQNAQRNSGFYNTKILEPVPTYNATEGEKIIQGSSNTIIILGRDRPGSEYSGKGATPNTHVGCIDIIAGLTGMMAREVDNRGEEVLSNKSTQLDAARIYISQRADIDSPEYFNLAEGKVGNLTNRSAIAIKADSVRIIGREGIKLVTSTDTYSGGAGQFIGDNIQGIDLIAGNNDSDLQPIVKGDDLAKILDDLLELVTHVQSSTSFTLELLTSLLAAFVDPTGAAVARLKTLFLRLPIEVTNLSIQEKNFVYHRLNYSNKNPLAKYNFRSKYNNVN